MKIFAYFLAVALPVSLFCADAVKEKPAKHKIAIIGSDRPGYEPSITTKVQSLAKGLNKDKYTLIYDGGTKGIRHAMVEEFRKKGGEVIAYSIPEEKTGNPENIEVKLFDNDFDRFKQMYDDAKVFILLPGGIESIAEVSWVIDQNALKKRETNIIAYNCNGYWDRFFQMIDFLKKEGFLDHRKRFYKLVKKETQEETIYSHLNYLCSE